MKIPNDVLPPAYSESTQPIPTQEHAGPSQPPPLTLTLAHPSTTESRSLEWTSRWAFRPSSTLNASNYPSSTLRRLESLPKSSRTANYNYLKRMAETEAKGVAYFREKSLAWIGLWDTAAVWWDERWMLECNHLVGGIDSRVVWRELNWLRERTGADEAEALKSEFHYRHLMKKEMIAVKKARREGSHRIAKGTFEPTEEYERRAFEEDVLFEKQEQEWIRCWEVEAAYRKSILVTQAKEHNLQRATWMAQLQARINAEGIMPPKQRAVKQREDYHHEPCCVIL